MYFYKAVYLDYKNNRKTVWFFANNDEEANHEIQLTQGFYELIDLTKEY